MERRPGFQQESDDVGRARRREAAQNEDGEAAVRREALPRGERADADGAASSRCPRTASMSGRQCWREVKAAKGETRAEGKRASWVAGDEAEMANLATSDLATLRPVCVPTGGAPRGPWSLPSFVNEPPATLHLDRSRVDDGGEGCSTNVSEIFKRQIRLLVRDGYPCWTWTEHDTPQHTAAVALSPLAVPSRVEVSGYIGERAGVCLSRWLRGRDLSLRSNRTSG